MKNQNVRYILLIVAIIILIVQLFRADYSNFWSFDNLLSLSVPLLLILSMTLSIRHSYKNQEL